MRDPAAPRPCKEGQGRLIPWVHRIGAQRFGERPDHPRAPSVERFFAVFALARETPEHGRAGIADEDHEPRFAPIVKRRHAVADSRGKPAERRESLARDGTENRMLEHGSFYSIVIRATAGNRLHALFFRHGRAKKGEERSSLSSQQARGSSLRMTTKGGGYCKCFLLAIAEKLVYSETR